MAVQNDKLLSPSISERVAIVRSLMAQDRNEVRRHQDDFMKLSFLMVPAFIGVAVFYDAHPSLGFALLIGQFLLLALYVVVSFVTLLKSLPDARACLTNREEYFEFKEDQPLLFKDAFNPLREPDPNKHYKKSGLDRHLWFPFGLTILAWLVTFAFMFWSFSCT